MCPFLRLHTGDSSRLPQQVSSPFPETLFITNTLRAEAVQFEWVKTVSDSLAKQCFITDGKAIPGSYCFWEEGIQVRRGRVGSPSSFARVIQS